MLNAVNIGIYGGCEPHGWCVCAGALHISFCAGKIRKRELLRWEDGLVRRRGGRPARYPSYPCHGRWLADLAAERLLRLAAHQPALPDRPAARARPVRLREHGRADPAASHPDPQRGSTRCCHGSRIPRAHEEEAASRIGPAVRNRIGSGSRWAREPARAPVLNRIGSRAMKPVETNSRAGPCGRPLQSAPVRAGKRVLLCAAAVRVGPAGHAARRSARRRAAAQQHG
jgi:hypothetical protein